MHIKERDISLFLDNALEPEKRDKLKEHFSVARSVRLSWRSGGVCTHHSIISNMIMS